MDRTDYNLLFCRQCNRSYSNNVYGRHDCVATEKIEKVEVDEVNHPPHYTVHPSGVECIQVTEHMNFCLGNAMKYIWRAGLKCEDAVVDLQKAKWYIEREIARLEKR